MKSLHNPPTIFDAVRLPFPQPHTTLLLCSGVEIFRSGFVVLSFVGHRVCGGGIERLGIQRSRRNAPSFSKSTALPCTSCIRCYKRRPADAQVLTLIYPGCMKDWRRFGSLTCRQSQSLHSPSIRDPRRGSHQTQHLGRVRSEGGSTLPDPKRESERGVEGNLGKFSISSQICSSLNEFNIFDLLTFPSLGR